MVKNLVKNTRVEVLCHVEEKYYKATLIRKIKYFTWLLHHDNGDKHNEDMLKEHYKILSILRTAEEAPSPSPVNKKKATFIEDSPIIMKHQKHAPTTKIFSVRMKKKMIPLKLHLK